MNPKFWKRPWSDLPKENLHLLDLRVRHGIDLLDEVYPRWREKVSKQFLSMQSDTMCVLGQVYGSYGTGLYNLDLCAFDVPMNPFSADSYGFHVPSFWCTCTSTTPSASCVLERYYAYLDHAWQKFI